MAGDLQSLFLRDVKLGDIVFKFYFFSVVFTFVLSFLLTQRVIEAPQYIQVLSVQLFLAIGLVWIYKRHKWEPLLGSFKRIFSSVSLLVLIYFGILFFANLILSHWISNTEFLWNFSGSQLQLLSLLVLAPINEELFFRDLLFRTQNARWNSFWKSALFSSLAFMLAHLSIYPGAFLLGIVSCSILVLSRSIVPCIVFHFLSNASLIFIPKFFPALAQWLLELGLFPSFYR